MPWGTILGGAAALAGNYFDSKKNREAVERENAKNMAAQKEFAQHGIRWKVEDAKRAGISPEFALGASTHSPSFASQAPMTDFGRETGQNIQRAVLATMDKESRQIDEMIKAETLRGMRLTNDQIDPTRNPPPPGNPPFPSQKGNVVSGQGDSPIKDVQLERTGMSKTTPYSEGGSLPIVGWAMTSDGGLRPVPSKDVKERIEDQIVPETLWAIQNLAAPNFGKGPTPPKDALPKGSPSWRWSMSRQAFYPTKAKYKVHDPNEYWNLKKAQERIPKRRK